MTAVSDPTHGTPHPGAPRRRSVCVYCGSKPGADPAYARTARRFGAGLAERGLRLVYGAGDLGLMGETARACAAAGGETLGVIPRDLWRREVTDRAFPGVIVTENLHQRKSLMLSNADAVAVLPGGIGTLDEMVEAVTWRQIGLHAKPIVLVDSAGYWAPLIALLRHFSEQGFAYDALDACFIRADGAETALDAIDAALAKA